MNENHIPGTIPLPHPATPSRPRVWPGLLIVVIMWPLISIPGKLWPATMAHFMTMMWGTIVCSALVLLWWLFASRVSWGERFVGVFGFFGLAAAAYPFWHESLNGFGLLFYAMPLVVTTWVVCIMLARKTSPQFRSICLLVVFAASWGLFGLIRFAGADGNLAGDLRWRWAPSEEELFLAQQREDPTPRATAKPLVLQAGDWAEFRGSKRDGRLAGVKIDTDWEAHPPQEIWRRRIGPGWGSFCVIGKHLFTQEQRGDDEVVVCYDADTGNEVWVQRLKERFMEAVAGPGPRATPTFHEGKLYTMGAKGKLQCLDAATGKVHWRRDVLAESGAKLPNWAYAASPLVVDGIVSVFAGGPDDKGVLAYDATSGEPAWSAPTGELSYASLQKTTIDGVDQVLLTTSKGLTSYYPHSGKVLWEHDWKLPENFNRVIQPAQIGDTDFLIGTGLGHGTRRIHVTHADDAWKTTELWTTKAIKPYYSDLVIHKNHLYGFDGQYFTCVDLDKGKARWRERGYGNGQVLLLADQDLLLIQGEQGEVALVDAVPDGLNERAKFQAISGKTWNHPVIAHGRLYVRNGEEAACFQLKELVVAAQAR